jgi:hypothetical protein
MTISLISFNLLSVVSFCFWVIKLLFVMLQIMHCLFVDSPIFIVLKQIKTGTGGDNKTVSPSVSLVPFSLHHSYSTLQSYINNVSKASIIFVVHLRQTIAFTFSVLTTSIHYNHSLYQPHPESILLGYSCCLEQKSCVDICCF